MVLAGDPHNGCHQHLCPQGEEMLQEHQVGLTKDHFILLLLLWVPEISCVSFERRVSISHSLLGNDKLLRQIVTPP